MSQSTSPSRPNPSREQVVTVVPGAPMLLGAVLLVAHLVFQFGGLVRGVEWGGNFHLPWVAVEVLVSTGNV